MTEGRLETESRCQECLAIIKGEVTSNNLSKRRVRTRTHGVVGGRGLVAPSYPIKLWFCALNLGNYDDNGRKLNYARYTKGFAERLPKNI